MISNWSKISSALPEHSPGTLFHIVTTGL